jgi:putative Mn2+ efflux pump MntP
VLALLLAAPLLGLDNFAAAASISVVSSDWRTCARVCAVFGCFALIAPLIGLALGEALASSVGQSGRVVGGIVLVLIGLRGLVADLRTPRYSRAEPRPAGYGLRSIVLIGWSVSTDTLAAGFGLGLYGVNIFAAAVIIACATAIMTLAGFYIGSMLTAEHLKRYADRISSCALALIGAALIGHLI